MWPFFEVSMAFCDCIIIIVGILGTRWLYIPTQCKIMRWGTTEHVSARVRHDLEVRHSLEACYTKMKTSHILFHC
jgi:hypothetical protein